MAETKNSPFKAYDIRGRVPEELNEDLAFFIGKACAQMLSAKRVVIGHDVRKTSPLLAERLAQGLASCGTEVLDIGLCGTEEVYFSTFHYKLDGGIMVTASHNPQEYNGMKLVRTESRPISGDSGLRELEAMVMKESQTGVPLPRANNPVSLPLHHRQDYIQHLLSYFGGATGRSPLLKPFRIVVDAGNGCAGPVIDALEPFLPFEFIKICHEPNGDFPNGIPNPLLPENRHRTAQAVRDTKADLGIAWDGDFDRCFLFDENGAFVEGYYLVGLLAEAFLRKPHQTPLRIVHDPRLTWNTIELVTQLKGIPIQSKTGHAFIKERMRQEDAIYGGEMSGHHYFKAFQYCDSGMIPWLLITELLSQKDTSLSRLIEERKRRFPISGEINRRVSNIGAVLKAIEAAYACNALHIDYTDGLSMEFSDWRFNLRGSNTEPLLRLNVETRANERLLKEKTEELLGQIDNYAVK